MLFESRIVSKKNEVIYKINVLHLVESLRVGGAEIALIHYIKALGQEKYTHYVYTFGDDGPLKKEIEELGVKVNFGPKMRSIRNPIYFSISLKILISDVLNFCKNNEIDVIQSHLILPNQLSVLVGRLAGIPAYPTVHSTNSFEDNRSKIDLRIYIRKLVNSTIYKIANKIIAVSPAVKRSISDAFNIDKEKIIVVKNGIVKSDIELVTNKINAVVNLNKRKIRIIAVGRLVQLKQFDLLIKAVSLLEDKCKDKIEVIIVGEGSERVILENIINELNLGYKVTLLGQRFDVISLMNESHIFCLPSSYEGLSIAMIEAMSCSLPIVVSDAPGLRDCVINRYNGLMFKVGKVDELSKCLEELIENDNLRYVLSVNSKSTFRTEYDMMKNIKPLNKLFDQAYRHNGKCNR